MIIHYLEAVILGAVQGITEFLPISSTAHLIITQKIFGLDQQAYGLSFDMFTNIGTILAVLIFFWNDLKDIFGRLRLPAGKPLTQAEKIPWLILGATVPVGLVGLLLEKKIETTFRSLTIIAASLVIVGIVMIIAERRSQAAHSAGKEPSPFQVILTSLSQCFALIPGVSRSGITISTSMFMGIDRVTAARYSFMLSLPITAAATLKKLYDFAKDVHASGIEPDRLAFYLIGAIVSFITGYITLKFLLRFYSRYSLSTFAYYRFALAGVLLLLISMNIL